MLAEKENIMAPKNLLLILKLFGIRFFSDRSQMSSDAMLDRFKIDFIKKRKKIGFNNFSYLFLVDKIAAHVLLFLVDSIRAFSFDKQLRDVELKLDRNFRY